MDKLANQNVRGLWQTCLFAVENKYEWKRNAVMEVPNRLGKQDIMRDKDFMLKLYKD
jgi:hypothetical protein